MVPSLSQSSSASNPGRVSGSDSSGSSKSTDVSSSKNLRKKSTVKQQLGHGQSAHRPIPTKAPNKPLGSRASKTDNNEYYKEEDSRTPGSSDRKSDSEFIPKDTSYEDDNGIYPCQKNSHKGRRSLEVSNNRPKNRANEVDGSGSPVSKEGTEEVVEDPSGTISEIRKVFNNGQPVERLVNYPELEEALTHFKENFIPYLQNNENKVWQAKAEIENLKHISNCADYMLNNMKFKPEFVAKIAATRLNMAMFRAGNFQNQNNGTPSKDYGKIDIIDPKEDYQPSCMWDFGEDRTRISLKGTNYESGGILSSPKTEENTEKGISEHDGNKFSFIRGRLDDRNENYEDCYIMPNGQKTSCLSNRFRQYLRGRTSIVPPVDAERIREGINDFLSRPDIEQLSGNIDSDEVKTILNLFAQDMRNGWSFLDAKTSLTNLPPSLVPIIGMQFGQIRQGTENPFTVAIQKYLALQISDGSPDNFFWADDQIPKELAGADQETITERAFGNLIAYVYGQEISNREDVLSHFEEGVCAYYAMTQEVLSRTSFPGNDTNYIETIFRLEDTDAVEAMGIVKKEETSCAYNDLFDSSKAKRLVLASTSLAAPLASLDHPAEFPPPIKIITKYENVHHACIFGCHLFNPDFLNATRLLGKLLPRKGQKKGTGVGTYNSGCPFFNDYQREGLVFLSGLPFETVGILIAAIDSDLSYVASGEDWLQEVKNEYEWAYDEQGKLKEGSKQDEKWEKTKWQINFFYGDGPVDPNPFNKKKTKSDNNLHEIREVIKCLSDKKNFSVLFRRKFSKKSTGSTKPEE